MGLWIAASLSAFCGKLLATTALAAKFTLAEWAVRLGVALSHTLKRTPRQGARARRGLDRGLSGGRRS